MQSKHFLNDPNHLVITALQSLTITNPSLGFDAENRIIYRRGLTNVHDSGVHKVSIVSGGGSGHEPGFAGFVGKGLLTSCVAGSIFASPAAEQVRCALLNYVPTQKGILVLVMNYTGDVLNFGIAAEKARASGVNVEFVIIGDDVSVGRTKGGKVGRRGIAGSVLVAKIAGALAELGGSLVDVHRVAKLVAENTVSIGSSMDRAHVPGRIVESPGSLSEELTAPDEVEVGMGIHNEAGTSRIKANLPELVKIMLAQILDPTDTERHFIDIAPSDKVVVFINNLGGVSMLELGGITAEVCTQLKRDYTLTLVRVISGTFLTSLNGFGWSVTLLKLQDTGLGPSKSMMKLLDLPSEAIGWSAPVSATTWAKDEFAATNPKPSLPGVKISDNIPASNLSFNSSKAYTVLRAGLTESIASEPDVTKYDTILGDGDCGISLKRTAEGVLAMLSATSNIPSDAITFVDNITTIVERSMDGTSGAIYAIFLNALASSLREQNEKSLSTTEVDAKMWATLLQSSLEALRKYTPASPGDRTLMDSLVPFIETLSSTLDIRQAAQASRNGALETKSMKPRLGRVVYVGGEAEWMNKIPDPGAWGLAAFFDGIAEAVAMMLEESGQGR